MPTAPPRSWLELTFEPDCGTPELLELTFEPDCGTPSWLELTFEHRLRHPELAGNTFDAGCGTPKWLELTFEADCGTLNWLEPLFEGAPAPSAASFDQRNVCSTQRDRGGTYVRALAGR